MASPRNNRSSSQAKTHAKTKTYTNAKIQSKNKSKSHAQVKSSKSLRNTKSQPSQSVQNVTQKAGQAASGIIASLFDLIRSSRIALLLTISLGLLLFGGAFDFLANYGKAYAGVTAGGIDVGGLTAEEIKEAVSKEYGERLNSAGVSIYANQDDFNDRSTDFDEYYDYEEISVEEERARTRSWSTDAGSLQAYIDYDLIVSSALEAGRDNPLDRLKLFFSGRDIDITLNYNEAIIESLANDIDLSIGNPLVNYGVGVEDGYVYVIEGEDGNMVNRQKLKDQISSLLLSPDADNRYFVVETEYTPVQINRAAAEKCVNLVSKAITQGVLFVYNGNEWLADAATLGSWVQVPITKDTEGNYSLSPSFALQDARKSVLTHIQPTFEGGTGHIRFTKEGGEIRVKATSEGTFPLVGDALDELNVALFGDKANKSSITISEGSPIRLELGSADVPESMSLDEALSFGIVTPISSFETEYTSGAYERNSNIHLAADLINNSIIPADGGEWSYNETTGECNAEKGFLEAGAIAGNTLIDEIGGGICQVATTIFNAVYEAGYPITERHNHTIYFSSYPQGRDAAVSWPSPDLKWKNNSPSDILLRMSYTDTTVTATLYGESMGYIVETEVGEQQEGAPFTTVYVTDDTLYPGGEYVRTYGYDGHTITVTRKVYDSQRKLVSSDDFTSIYAPQNTIIVRGPQTGS